MWLARPRYGSISAGWRCRAHYCLVLQSLAPPRIALWSPTSWTGMGDLLYQYLVGLPPRFDWPGAACRFLCCEMISGFLESSGQAMSPVDGPLQGPQPLIVERARVSLESLIEWVPNIPKVHQHRTRHHLGDGTRQRGRESDGRQTATADNAEPRLSSAASPRPQ